jgi:predicted transcriptional regulator
VLLLLAASEDPVRLLDLADHADVARSAVRSAVNLLVRAGFVARSLEPTRNAEETWLHLRRDCTTRRLVALLRAVLAANRIVGVRVQHVPRGRDARFERAPDYEALSPGVRLRVLSGVARSPGVDLAGLVSQTRLTRLKVRTALKSLDAFGLIERDEAHHLRPATLGRRHDAPSELAAFLQGLGL